jgi:hypothetical protein
MAFSDPAYGRVARHLPYKVEIDSYKRRFGAQARGCRGCLASRVARTYHYHIKSLVEHIG